ncbi:MAG TPA: YihY/virulence factor BrkB family protein [Verrucomicrobiae bacterium]|nr:YihY/virulence factor BrkB family protein [Verrucomicrobiae bacterium]
MDQPADPGPALLLVARRVLERCLADDVAGYAAQVAYSFLFALFPFLLFLVTLLAFMPVQNLMGIIMEFLRRLLPREVAGMVEENVRTLVMEQKGGLLSLGAALALWSSSSGVATLARGLNRAYRVTGGSALLLQVRGLAIVVGFSLLSLFSTLLLMFGPRVGRWIASRTVGDAIFTRIWNLAMWPAILLSALAAVAIVYAFGPDLPYSSLVVLPGAALAVALWIPASLGFSWYAARFGEYEKTYGSIGAVIILLTWLYISSLVLLVGGELNAVLRELRPL